MTIGSGCLFSNRSFIANLRFYYIGSAVWFGVKEWSERKTFLLKVVGKGPYWGYGSGQKVEFPAGSASTASFWFRRHGAIWAEQAVGEQK